MQDRNTLRKRISRLSSVLSPQSLAWILTIGLLAWLGFAIIRRAALVHANFESQLDCVACLWPTVVAQDALVMFLVATFLLLAACLKSVWIRAPLLLAACGLVGLHSLDLYLVSSLGARLNAGWVAYFLDDASIIADHLSQTASADPWLVLGVLPLALLVVAVFLPLSWGRGARSALAVVALASLLTWALTPRAEYVHQWALVSILDTKFSISDHERHSEDYLALSRQRFPDRVECQSGEASERDVIVLLLESWSPAQSELFSGINDYTPGLDALASRHSYFTQLHAVGYATNHGLMGSLAGTPIVVSYHSLFDRLPFDAAWGWDHTLPHQLQGYDTAFLTSGDLGFTDKGSWLDHIGFEHLEGHQQPAYEGLDRYHFGAAADSHLYRRVLDFLQQRDSSRPLFMAVQNVSTHHPFFNPETGERGTEAAFRYMDQTVVAFEQALRERGFFEDDGLLVLVSDHRTMTPMTAQEVEVLGEAAEVLVPMVLIANDERRGHIDHLYSHADLAPSLAKAMTGQGCGYPGWASIFDSTTGRDCAYYASLGRWDQLGVACRSGHGLVTLQGDDSYFETGSGLSEAQQKERLQEIASLREWADRMTRRHWEKAEQ